MRHSPFLLPVLIFLGIAVGGALYLFGGPRFSGQPDVSTPTGETFTGRESFRVVAEGDTALGVVDRVNYRIVTKEEFGTLWEMMFNGMGGDVPPVDFSREEVFAIFDGTRSTTGFRVRVMSVEDGDGVRTVTLVREFPGDDCTVVSEIRSPFVLVRAARSSLPIVRQESTATSTCAR